MVTTVRYGQPPPMMRLRHLVYDHEYQDYYMKELKNAKTSLYVRVDEKCTTTLIINGLGAKDVYFKFYSGNNGITFQEYRFIFERTAKSGRYNVTGGNEYLTIKVDLQRNSKTQTESDTAKQFTYDHLNKIPLKEPTIDVCLVHSESGFYGYFDYSSPLETILRNLESVIFFCSETDDLDDDDTKNIAKLSAWPCNFDDDTPPYFSSYLVHYKSCREDEYRMKIKSTDGKEAIVPFHQGQSKEPFLKQNNNIRLYNINITTWESYRHVKIVNDRRAIYMMEWSRATGNCEECCKDYESYKIELWNGGSGDPILAYLRYIRIDIDNDIHVASFTFVDESDVSKCHFYQIKDEL